MQGVVVNKNMMRAFIFLSCSAWSALSYASAGIEMAQAIRARLAAKDDLALLCYAQGLQSCIASKGYGGVIDVLLSPDTTTFKQVVVRPGSSQDRTTVVQFVLVNHRLRKHCVFDRLLSDDGVSLNRKARRDNVFRPICNQLISYFDNVDYEAPGSRCEPVKLEIVILPPSGGGDAVLTLREIVGWQPAQQEEVTQAVFETHMNRAASHQHTVSSQVAAQHHQQPVPTVLRQQPVTHDPVVQFGSLPPYPQPPRSVQPRLLNFSFDMNVFRPQVIKYDDAVLRLAAGVFGISEQEVQTRVLNFFHSWATTSGQAFLLSDDDGNSYLELHSNGMYIIFDNVEWPIFNRIIEVTATSAALNRSPVNVRMAIESMQGVGRLVMVCCD